MRLGKKLTREERGQALVEFSFICVILLMLAGGVADGIILMRCNIALSGAATEVVNRISLAAATETEVSAICKDVIINNYPNILGDRNTTYSCLVSEKVEAPVAVDIPYIYHDYEHGIWSGNRAYKSVTVTLERDQVLLSPFGQLVFGDSGNGGRRRMKVTARTRVYMDME